MTLGDRTYEIENMVADITPEWVLGMKFLTDLDASLDFLRGELRIGETTHCLQGKLPVRSCAVQVERTVMVPPLSEAVVSTRPRDMLATTTRRPRPQLLGLTPLMSHL